MRTKGFYRIHRTTWQRVMLCLVCLALLAPSSAFPAGVDAHRWWPVQTVPRGLVRLSKDGYPEPRAASEMMAQSVAGLAAKAVNEGRADELVWMETDNVDIEDWLARRLKHEPQLEQRGTFALWDLVDRYTRMGIIKGYILYRPDRSVGELNDHRPNMDCSVNVATSVAGLLDGIIVDEAHGGRCQEAMDSSCCWMRPGEDPGLGVFATYQHLFNRQMLCTQDPRKPNSRDLAIAHKVLTVFGYDEPSRRHDMARTALADSGRECGDEFEKRTCPRFGDTCKRPPTGR